MTLLKQVSNILTKLGWLKPKSKAMINALSGHLCIESKLLEKSSPFIADAGSCVCIARSEGTAVITSIQPIHPAAVNIEQTVDKP